MRHSMSLVVCFILVAVTGAAAADKEVESRALNYYKNGKAIVDMVLLKRIDVADVEKRVEELVADAVWMCNAYAQKYPAGAKLLKTVTDNLETMKKADYNTLEKEWHDLGYFKKPGNEPGIDLGNEDNEHFTDPIHAIVHPLLVLKAAKAWSTSKSDTDLQNIKQEMEEGIQQQTRAKEMLQK